MRKLLMIILFLATSTIMAGENDDGDSALSVPNGTASSTAKSQAATSSANIDTNASFQEFEDEYNLGFGYSHGGLINGQQQGSSYDEKTFNLEVERLFNDGIWLDGNFDMVTQYNQPDLGPNTGPGGSGINGGEGSGQAFGQNPFMYGFTLKGGYGFQLIRNTLQIIPYAMFGRSSNVATSTVLANGSNNITSDYFYTGGLGTRLDYRINRTFMLYADELYTYNWDNSGAVQTIQNDTYGKSYAATNYELTSTIGAKFNIWANLQLGINGFWTFFQPQSNISGLIYTPDNIYGVMGTIGLTY